METDGIISVVPGTSAFYTPDTAYDIVHLNLVLLLSTASIWPRIDLDARCTKPLADGVRASLSNLLKP